MLKCVFIDLLKCRLIENLAEKKQLYVNKLYYLTEVFVSVWNIPDKNFEGNDCHNLYVSDHQNNVLHCFPDPQRKGWETIQKVLMTEVNQVLHGSR